MDDVAISKAVPVASEQWKSGIGIVFMCICPITKKHDRAAKKFARMTGDNLATSLWLVPLDLADDEEWDEVEGGWSFSPKLDKPPFDRGWPSSDCICVMNHETRAKADAIACSLEQVFDLFNVPHKRYEWIDQ